MISTNSGSVRLKEEFTPANNLRALLSAFLFIKAILFLSYKVRQNLFVVRVWKSILSSQGDAL